jgi:hypothetical protein
MSSDTECGAFALEVECPSGLKIRVRKLKVRQFKLLGNRQAIESGEVYEAFLNACADEIVDPGPYDYTPGTVFDWKKALQGDRFVALLGIRRATHPTPFDFDIQCSKCGKEYGWSVPLEDLPIVPYPETSLNAFKAREMLSVEVGGRVVQFRLMTGAEEERIRNHLARAEKSDKRTRKHPFDPLVDGAIARFASIAPKPEDVHEWYEDLEVDDMLKISSALEATSGGVETTVECVHDNALCGGVTKVELPFASRDFWIPKGPGKGSAI